MPGVKQAGVPALEDVRDEMREGAMNEAKGKLYASKMDGANLEDIAKAIGETVKTGRDLSIKFPTVEAEHPRSPRWLVLHCPFLWQHVQPHRGHARRLGHCTSKGHASRHQRQLLGRTKHARPRARTNFPFTVLNTMQKAAGVEDNRRQLN